MQAFKISAGSARPETQIHTHMCYSEFNEIIESVAALDADVITIETSRSNMDLLKAFEEFNYPNEIGPACTTSTHRTFPHKHGLKICCVKRQKNSSTAFVGQPRLRSKNRNWPEVETALTNMVNAAKALRAEWQA